MGSRFSSQIILILAQVGIGLCEEAILLVRYFLDTFALHQITLEITGSDISDAVIEKAKSNVNHFQFDEYIKIIHEDLLTADVSGKYEIVYTSAAVNELFNWKILYYAYKCDAVFYLFSKPMLDTYRTKEVGKTFVIRSKQFCEGRLNGSEEKRPVYYMEIQKMKANDCDALRSLLAHSSDLLWRKFQSLLDQGIWAYIGKIRGQQTTTPSEDSIRWELIDYKHTLSFLDQILQPLVITERDRKLKENLLKDKIRKHFIEEYVRKKIIQRIIPEAPPISPSSQRSSISSSQGSSRSSSPSSSTLHTEVESPLASATPPIRRFETITTERQGA
jgi:hypothetical protein